MERMALKRALESENVFDEFEDRRYLGMSLISKCPRWLYDVMLNGRKPPDLQSLRYFHEGYLHEADVIQRLGQAGIAVTNQQRELIAEFDDRFRGHIDGEIDNDLLEIKSVNSERFASLLECGAFYEHLDQCQMYMRYGGYQRAMIVYKCRDTGEIYVYTLQRSDRFGERLEQKAMAILRAVDERQPPVCTCGRCR